MTVSELLGMVIPVLGAIVLGILVVLGVQAVLILTRVKRMVERVETLSDISGWLGIARRFVSNKKQKK